MSNVDCYQGQRDDFTIELLLVSYSFLGNGFSREALLSLHAMHMSM